jgi:hypothetical protein
MSTIAKIAVYDARLQQDEPAYAVQKGALSVSVAPFQAISANSTAMTFQVLVPSLNVFVDRKIQLSTALNFTAQLFYGGPRGQSVQGYTTTIALGPGTSKIDGTLLTITQNPTINGTAQALPAGTKLWSLITGYPIAPGTVVLNNISGFVYRVNISQTWVPGSAALGFEAPLIYDVPEPVMGVQQQVVGDHGFSNAFLGEAFLPAGYATAVSSKDLALVSFPLQSCLSNMSATLNDCTVTTNGDTLREQILLTNERANVKQRTCPTNTDVFSWGRDDALNGSGNFASYSVVDAYGDIPNGAYPMTWYSDATQSSPLAAISALQPALPSASATASGVIQNATTTFPFLAAGTAGSFGLETASGNFSGSGGSGCGWYIAKVATSVTVPTSGGVTGSAGVIVPFVNGQPVWTTGFPGGDLICAGNTTTVPATNTTAALAYLNNNAGFVLSSSAADASGTVTLTLLRAVPPFCMIGARLYTTASAQAAAGGPNNALAWVSGIVSGALGAPGSVYNLITGTALVLVGQLGTTYSLGAGFQVTQGPMPVFGSVQCVEPLVLSPLIWADSAEFASVGLYGMTNMQFVLNFAVLGTCFAGQNAVVTGVTGNTQVTLPYWIDDLTKPTNNTGNIIRSSNIRTVMSDLAFGSSTNQYGPWQNPTLYVGFLTPGPDVTLPLVSTVPYVEMPRYTKTDTWSSFSGRQSISTNTISLTSIPDMIMVYVKPATKGPSQLDQYIPISSVSVTFDNFSNLCSGFQQFNLYESAVAAGLDMDWHQWRGFTQAAYPSLARVTSTATPVSTAAQPKYRQTGYTQLSGGPILLRMGSDITLSPGLAPGCLGNYSIQINLQTSNPYGYYDSISSTQTTLIAINTGFFETVRGQSAIRKTILNSADVEAASPESGMTKTHLNRMIGHGWASSIASGAQKALAVAKKASDLNKQYDITGKAAALGVPGAAQAAKGLQYADQANAVFGHGKRHRSGLV